jgi:hypothetical protein
MSMEMILQMAAAGGAALAGAAGTDAWKYARDGFTRLLGRGDPQRADRARRRLDATAEVVVAAPEPDRPAVRDAEQLVWQTRLRDAIEEDEALAGELGPLVEEIGRRLPAAEQRWVQHVTVSGAGAQANVVQGGNIVNHYSPGSTER